TWQRPGVPQFRHSHAFLARLRLVLLAHLPELLDRLRALGVRELGLAEIAPPGITLAHEDGDEEVVLLACRRATFEWALRECVRMRPGIELREGVSVAGLSASRRDGRRPTVDGVRLADGAVLPAAQVLVLGRFRIRLRRFGDRDGPVATGFFTIGDAAYHSNPVYGRGSTFALVQAALLDGALGRYPRDLTAAARFLDRESERELR